MKRKRKEKVEIEVGKFNLRLFTDIVVKVSIHPPQINTDLQCATHEPNRKSNETACTDATKGESISPLPPPRFPSSISRRRV